MDGSADRFLDLMHQSEDFTHSVSPEQAHTQFDETTLQLFWMRWPQLSEWAGSLWRLLSEELGGASGPHKDSELLEIGGSGWSRPLALHGRRPDAFADGLDERGQPGRRGRRRDGARQS